MQSAALLKGPAKVGGLQSTYLYGIVIKSYRACELRQLLNPSPYARNYMRYGYLPVPVPPAARTASHSQQGFGLRRLRPSRPSSLTDAKDAPVGPWT